MNTKFTPHRYLWMVLLALLAACTPAQLTTTDVQNTAIAKAQTSIPLTQTALPAITPSLTGTAATIASTSTPLPQLSIPFPLDAIRMAYVINGNLYLQVGSNQPQKLTDSGEDYSPIFSDDGEKIVFFRGLLPHNVYSINTDGSQEQELVSSNLLTALDMGYHNSTEVRSLSLIPGTHQLLFATHELDSFTLSMKDLNRSGAKPNQDLLLVDIDTAEIRRILPSGQGGIFQVSPNGKLVGIQTTDHIDVIGINGQIILPKLATYPSAWLYKWTPDIYWTNDSAKLYIALPISTGSALNSSGPDARTIWQYTLDGSPTLESHLNPSPIGETFNISPDGNWIVYTYFYYEGKTPEAMIDGIYIGNLHNGSSQLVAPAKLYGLPNSFFWSPNSLYFAFEDAQTRLILGNVNGEITSIGDGQFLGWIDATHYLYRYGKLFLGKIGAEGNLLISDMPGPLSNTNPFIFIVLETR